MNKAWLWVTGRKAPWIKKPKTSKCGVTGLEVHMIKVPEYLWQNALTGDFFSFSISTETAPCFLHRWAQRFCFGIKWRFYKKEYSTFPTPEPTKETIDIKEFN